MILKNLEQPEIDDTIKCINFDRSSIYEIPIELINLPNLENISLNNNNISKIPVEILQLKNLKTLSLNNNLFTEIPIIITEMMELCVLSMSGNKINQIPCSQFEYIKNIESVNLSNNQISISDDDITDIAFYESCIKELVISNNLLENIPSCIYNFRCLNCLDISSNKISDVCYKLAFLTSLEMLILDNNKIKDIYQISYLKTLEKFSISNNCIKELPIFPQTLEYLDVSRNRILTIPSEIGFLPKIKTLIANNNPLIKIPINISRLIQQNGDKLESKTKINKTILSIILNKPKQFTMSEIDVSSKIYTISGRFRGV
jgi:leucine-rich repeat protein SHOC2